MRRSSLLALGRNGALGVLMLVLAAAGARSQQPQANATQPDGATGDSLRELQEELKALSAAVREMHSEVALSRNEALELRRELEQTREQLASLKRQMNAPGEEATASGRAGNAPEYLAGKGTNGTQPGAHAGVPSQESASERQTTAGTSTAGAEVSDRLKQVEEDQKLLETKVKDQYQTKVESGSKYRVRLSGIALLNTFGTRGTVDNLDLPQVALAKTPTSAGKSFGATVRQSQLGLEVFGPELAGAKTSADLQVDFFGGFPNEPDGVAAGLLRLRTARVRFDWSGTSVVAGQDAPFFSPLSPSSLAALGTPALAYAGNLWTWTPQVRVERRFGLSENSKVLVQAGILDPLTGELPYNGFYRIAQAGERSGQPAYAARVAWTAQAFGQPLTVGAGGYYARQDWGFSRAVDAWAGTADWDLPLRRRLSLDGEFYRGRAIGGLGGSLGRSVIFSGPPLDPTTSVLGLNAAGGWSQLKFSPSERLEFNGAFGEDYTFARDLTHFPNGQSFVYPSLGRNQSAFVNGIYRARSNLLLSLEYRRLWTSDLDAAKYTVDHLNMSIGVLF